MSSPHPLWGQRIHAARHAAGISQAAVARALGVTQQQVSKWERGETTPRDRYRLPLARLLGIPVYQLFPFDEDNGDEEAA